MIYALKQYKRKAQKFYWGGVATLGLLFSSEGFAAKEWFPKTYVQSFVDNKDGMTAFSEIVVKGLKVLLLCVSVGALFKFASTVSHGIDEAKKAEGGMMAVFSTYAAMSLVYLLLSLGTAYLAVGVLGNFSLA